jgi:hypothetical protein
VNVRLVLETRDSGHVDQVRQALADAGFRFQFSD